VGSTCGICGGTCAQNPCVDLLTAKPESVRIGHLAASVFQGLLGVADCFASGEHIFDLRRSSSLGQVRLNPAGGVAALFRIASITTGFTE
jgi:hypothetical protein